MGWVTTDDDERAHTLYPVQRIGSFIEECRVFVGRDEA